MVSKLLRPEDELLLLEVVEELVRVEEGELVDPVEEVLKLEVVDSGELEVEVEREEELEVDDKDDDVDVDATFLLNPRYAPTPATIIITMMITAISILAIP